MYHWRLRFDLVAQLCAINCLEFNMLFQSVRWPSDFRIKISNVFKHFKAQVERIHEWIRTWPELELGGTLADSWIGATTGGGVPPFALKCAMAMSRTCWALSLPLSTGLPLRVYSLLSVERSWFLWCLNHKSNKLNHINWTKKLLWSNRVEHNSKIA